MIAQTKNEQLIRENQQLKMKLEVQTNSGIIEDLINENERLSGELRAVLPVAFRVEPDVIDNLVQLSVIPSKDSYTIEIVYQTDEEEQ